MSSDGIPHLVEKAEKYPHKCLITGDIDGPFVDFGYEFHEVGTSMWTHVYISAAYLKYNVGRDALGMLSEDEAKLLEDERDDLLEQVDALQMAFDALSSVKKEVAA